MPSDNKYKQVSDIARSLGIYVSTGNTVEKKAPRYVIIKGNGQNTFSGDDTYIWRENLLQIEYYFTKKNVAEETAFEDRLLEEGLLYNKSEDVFIEEEGVFLIYYDV